MRSSFTVTLGALALAAVLTPGAASARNDQMQQQGAEPSAKHGVQGTHDAGTNTMPKTAQEFVREAADGGLAEVALGKMAVAQAESPEVKQFGQRMVDDHSKANQELTSLASQKGIAAPTEPSAKHKATIDRLSKLSGAAFDRAYMQAMVTDHDHDVAAFKSFSERGDDPELKQFAEKTLPTLQEHDRLAKTTANKVGVTAKMTGDHTRISGEDAARASKGATRKNARR
jgi:putative membrane protein